MSLFISVVGLKILVPMVQVVKATILERFAILSKKRGDTIGSTCFRFEDCF
jgi:hypothetical protein